MKKVGSGFEDLTSEGFSEYRPDFEEMSASSESELQNTHKSSTFGTIGRKRIQTIMHKPNISTNEDDLLLEEARKASKNIRQSNLDKTGSKTGTSLNFDATRHQ
jgi:hypothetical protein